jgi:hypothetical protein
MTWPVKEINRWSTWIRWYTVSVFGLQNVCVHRCAFTSVQVNNLNSETYRLEQDIDKKNHSDMINLIVYRFQHILPVSFDTTQVYDIVLVCRLMPRQP